jgi:hypothetical protein
LMYGQRTTNGFGSYVGPRITKLSMQLALTLMYEQRNTDGVGCYVGPRITKLPVHLALTLMCGQCTTHAAGYYILELYTMDKISTRLLDLYNYL